jgi:hypothetical protein
MRTLTAPSPPFHFIPCPITLKHDRGRSVVSVTSPLTGKTLRFNDGWRSRLDRIWSRIISTAADGRHVASFTADELKTLAWWVTPAIMRNLAQCNPARHFGGTVHGVRFKPGLHDVMAAMDDRQLLMTTNEMVSQYRELLTAGRLGSQKMAYALPDPLDDLLNECAMRGLVVDPI